MSIYMNSKKFSNDYLWTGRIESHRLRALMAILHEPMYSDEQKITIISQMHMKDPRYQDIIIAAAEPFADQAENVKKLKTLTRHILEKVPFVPTDI